MRNCATKSSRQNRFHSATGAVAFTLLGLLAACWPAEGQTIPLGEAANLTVLGGSTVTNSGLTTVVGNLGLSPGSSVTGFPPGTITNGSIQINTDLANQAHQDASTAYGQLAGENLTTDLTGQNLGGMILTPGIYHFDTTAVLDGTLTLNTGGDPNATFHFQIGTTLTTGIASSIALLNGGSTNVFWQIGTSATIGIGSAFYGTLLADQNITINNGANFEGRAIAINGAVTMDSDNMLGPDAVPEPGTWCLTTLGLSGLWLGRRLRR